MSVAGDSQLDAKADRKARKVQQTSQAAEWRGFVNVDLSVAQKAQFEDWSRTGEPWGIFDAAIESGIVCTIKRDSGGSGYLASGTQRNSTSVNAGFCITARAGEPSKAWGRLMFVLHVVGVLNDWSAAGTVSDPDRW